VSENTLAKQQRDDSKIFVNTRLAVNFALGSHFNSVYTEISQQNKDLRITVYQCQSSTVFNCVDTATK